MSDNSIRVCSRCVYDASMPGITFDSAGVCNYCHLHDDMDVQYPTGSAGAAILERMAERIRREGEGKPYDCVVGVSGGCDSSFLLVKMVELGLRPLAVHFDNTWNSPTATQNIYNVVSSLGLQLETYVVNNKEYDDIYRSFLVSGVRDIEAPTDIGLTTVLYRAAEKHRVRYIMEGHSFRTEGISPLGWIYMDGRYIAGIHRQFGTRPMETFPNLWLKDFLRWAAIKNIKRIRPIYYLEYRKAEAKEMLAADHNWHWYGGHHLENRFTAFYHTLWMPKRYGIDGRKLGHAALVRSNQLDRDVALDELATPARPDPEITALVRKRLGFSEPEFEAVFASPRRNYWDYPTYKKTFEWMRPLFWVLYKADRVPKSFYVKFTKKDPARLRQQILDVQKPVIEGRTPSD